MDRFKKFMKKGIDKVKSRVNKPSRGKDSKFFSGTKRGEIPELRGELHSGDRGVLKDAVKKVIANITVGKDMSPLFPDVISCMQTEDLELKKLVYLYLINYAKSNPDMTLLAVNTFVKDASHASPIIRALSVRTMGCIRVEKITEYLTKPLQAALNDEDPYVRKTGAVAVAKLYDISPAMVKEMGFISKLRDLICDGNPAVVANSVAALSEIQDTTTGNVFEITSAVLQKLLAAISECTEWGQVFILDALAKYDPVDSREAEQMIDRVLPRLAHQNAAVVLSAVKIVMKFMEHVQDPAAVDNFSRKLAPPLVTLAQSQMPEIQYVALRNILLIVQRRPQLLTQKIRVFFCKYHEPIYVKMEKLEILVRLASEKNIQQVLAELKEYATEVDVDFVRKSVRTIGRCAIKLERAAEACIQVLLDLISSKVNYVVQEAVVVIKDIFRRYPNKYEAVISVLCDSLESLDEPEAKASMIWIIGEYANRIENADELLQSFLDGFHDETTVVQLQLLTAAVKLYLKRPDEAEEKLVQQVLAMATEESDNPDLRDRGYVYWRLLSTDPEAARSVVLAEKPIINDDTNVIDPSLLDLLISNISTLASVYHKPPEAFVTRPRKPGDLGDSDTDTESDSEPEDSEGSEEGEVSPSAGGGGGGGAELGGEMDLLGMGDLMAPAPTPAPAPASSGGYGGEEDLFGGGFGGGSSAAGSSDPVLGTAGDFTVRGRAERSDGRIVYHLNLENGSSTPVSACKLKFKPNTFGLTSTQADVDFGNISPGGNASAEVPCHNIPDMVDRSSEPTLRVDAALMIVATKTVLYFSDELPFEVLLAEMPALSQSVFDSHWQKMEGKDGRFALTNLCSSSASTLMEKLSNETNLAKVGQKPGENGQIIGMYAGKTATNIPLLLEVAFKDGFPAVKVNLRCPQPVFVNFVKSMLTRVLG